MGQPVRVYRNLHAGRFSVQARTGKGWRVVAHVEALDLVGARLVVSVPGRERARREGRRNVHAYALGIASPPMAGEGERLTYSPFGPEGFRDPCGRLVERAEILALRGGRSLHLGRSTSST